ncbi:MAG TPA: 23S rRNA (pseudouridine(1915)-N(3))-methyltransferase RlmH [Bacteroidia bacterium]|nr:23S rRNA (pseudouridine(1915)-N(3))-methyltransferase RlmH [Bacteroidia bacterium]
MHIKLFFIGKTAFSYINDGIIIFEKRLSHYAPFEIITIESSKKSGTSKNELVQKQYEADLILKKIKPNDYLVLLDEKGKEYNSVQFSGALQKLMLSLQSNLIFIVGGAYGFDEKVYKRANMLLSLSKMTFSHQMIRLFFLEQLYRAMTIIRNEPYHHG